MFVILLRYVMKCSSGYHLQKPSLLGRCPQPLVEIIALCFWANHFVLTVPHFHAGGNAEIDQHNFGREWGYFYLLSAVETGITFGGVGIFRPCKHFLSRAGPSVARLPLLDSNIASAVIVINLSFFSVVISLHKSYLVQLVNVTDK